MTVYVHRNLSWQDGLGFSILDRDMRLQDRARYVVLTDCTFVVHDTDQHVHAFVKGTLTTTADTVDLPDGLTPVVYNPNDDRGFRTTDDDQEIWGAPTVWFGAGQAYVR